MAEEDQEQTTTEEEEDTTTDAGGGVTTDKSKGAVKKAEGKAGKGVGGAGPDEDTALTILTGKEMEWFFDKTTGKWYVAYGLPKSDMRMVFEASPEQMDALFGKGQRPVDYANRTLEQVTRGSKSIFGGDIAEMEGTGSFEAEVRRVKAVALEEGLLPDWADKTPEIMDILYVSQAESKSMEWTVEQISKTASFKERFPGINKIKEAGNLTLIDAITGFLEFEAGVRAAVNSIGGNINKVKPEVVGGLLKKGHSLETVTNTIAKFDRMRAYRPALQAFNAVLKANGMDPVKTLQDQFDFLSGNAPSDVYDVWEASSVAEAAAAAGLSDIFTAEDAMSFAVATEGTTALQDATGMFQEAAQMLLRLRNEVDMGLYGLDQEEVIDLALGQVPRSGRSAAEITENMNRAVLSAQKTLSGKAKPFKGFTDSGVQKDVSLGSLRDL